MQCHQILVDWVRMRDTRNNLEMTWSNGKSPKFLSKKLSTFKGEKICPKGDFVQILAWKRNHIKEPSQRRFDGGYEIMSRWIAFESPVVNSYAQSSSITSEQEKQIMTSLQPSLHVAVKKSQSGTVWESNSNKVEDILSFPMGIYLPSSDQRFRFYDYLHDDGFSENCNSGQTAVTREKLNLGLFGWDSSPELNTKKLYNSPRFPSVTYRASLDQRFRRYGIFPIGKTAENWTGQYNNWKK
jgi:hypothetical protein